MARKNVISTQRSNAGDSVVIFLHGLSGSAGTWDQMLQILVQCSELNKIAYDCYTFPTSKFRVPFGKKMPSIQELAEGLRGFIDGFYANKKRVVLIAHSLGGLVARNYILEAVKARREHKVIGLMLYASPLAGSGLANVGSKLSWGHTHLKQLSVRTDFLVGMNKDWKSMEVESKLHMLSIIAGIDAIVARESSVPYFDDERNITLIQCGHIDVTKPESLSDLRFEYLKRFVTGALDSSPMAEVARDTSAKSGDVLFDSYTPDVELFYLARREDVAVKDASNFSNVWISGPPGVGKTAALRRIAMSLEWKLHHIVLDAYRDMTAIGLMREVCNFLLDKAGYEEVLARDSSRADIINGFRKSLMVLGANSAVAILIEEIPLANGSEYAQFLDLCYQLTMLGESLCQVGRVVWLFSSILDPKQDVAPGVSKLHEKIHFIEFSYWGISDIYELCNLINSQLGAAFNKDELDKIIAGCKGSPRFIKLMFRRRRSEVGLKKSLVELLKSVEKDLAL